MVDQYGYPTEEELDAIDSFYGTPAEYVEMLRPLFAMGGVSDEIKPRGFFPGDAHEVYFVTGGFSGCERAISRMMPRCLDADFNLFEYLYWESSHRGGGYYFKIPIDKWDKPQPLGLLSRAGSLGKKEEGPSDRSTSDTESAFVIDDI